jgi:hypothetical protein
MKISNITRLVKNSFEQFERKSILILNKCTALRGSLTLYSFYEFIKVKLPCNAVLLFIGIMILQN